MRLTRYSENRKLWSASEKLAKTSFETLKLSCTGVLPVNHEQRMI